MRVNSLKEVGFTQRKACFLHSKILPKLKKSQWRANKARQVSKRTNTLQIYNKREINLSPVNLKMSKKLLSKYLFKLRNKLSYLEKCSFLLRFLSKL